MLFNIQPYQNANLLAFGIDESDVINYLGTPLRTGKNRRNELVSFYQDCSLTFSREGGLEEITFYPESDVQIRGVNIFKDKKTLVKLNAIDANPLEYVGIIFFPNLGITMTGFHNKDAKTATAISIGRLDGLLNKFTPFSINI